MLRAIFLLLAFFGAGALPAHAIELSSCGRVIGHEMGLWDNFAISPGPQQVDEALQSPVHFYKISLRKLKDGTWVVNHDSDRHVLVNGVPKDVHFSDLTWDDVTRLKSQEHSFVGIYKLGEYIARDQGKLCWLLCLKDPGDQHLIDLVKKLGIQNRTVLESGSLNDVKLLSEASKQTPLHFTARVFNSASELDALSPYLNQLWAVEIDPGKNTQAIAQIVKAKGAKTYVDSMRYSWNYELFGTACRKVFDMGIDYTQSNRPEECASTMGFPGSPAITDNVIRSGVSACDPVVK